MAAGFNHKSKRRAPRSARTRAEWIYHGPGIACRAGHLAGKFDGNKEANLESTFGACPAARSRSLAS